MRRIILAAALFMLFLPSAGNAESFSCRDQGGKLHVADNLMSLPADCRSAAETRDEEDQGKVNFVPQAVNQSQTNRRFKRALQGQQQETTRRNQESASLLAEANRLSTSYQDAVTTRYEAVRKRGYGSRKIIQKADQTMQTARSGKAQLLQRLKSARVTTVQRKEIEQLLKTIED